MNFQLKSIGTKTVGIILFSALLASCGTKRNAPIVTKNEGAGASSSPSSSAPSEGTENLTTNTEKSESTENEINCKKDAQVDATADCLLEENVNPDPESVTTLTIGNEDFSSLIIKSSEIVENGNANEVQYLTFEHRLEANGPRKSTMMTARHSTVDIKGATHVFANIYLPYGKFDVANNIFEVEVKDEEEFNALKASLLKNNGLDSTAALVTTSTINEFKFNQDDAEATKLFIPQTRVRFLRLNAQKIEKFTFEDAKAKSDCAYGAQYTTSILINLFELGDVSDFYTAPDKSLNVDFSNKETLFTSELSKTPSMKTRVDESTF
ncbi:MAG: hypothetical protein QE271_06420 [Bacteriovoracaceae bacterium]|nr:hypothetical protein [Bacteriovoracaceae bacterium]